jgi:glycosyltransferase involved in cell wall biosynthesis
MTSDAAPASDVGREWIGKTWARRAAVRAAVGYLRWRRRRRPRASRAARGVAVVGVLETASGLGAAARGLLAALEPLDPVPISIGSCAPTPWMPDAARGRPAAPAPEGPFDVGVHLYNPDVFLGLVRRHGGGPLLASATNLAVVNWETQRLPSGWPHILSLYERLAAPSRFTADAIRAATGRAVHVLPNCVALGPERVRTRSDGRYEFLCLFDHHSDLERKNPFAAIRAFRVACDDLPPGTSCRLRVKCHANTPVGIVASLRAAAGDAAVEVVPETLSRDGMQRLWDACDCLVSLHRSEGFGLPVAEALAQGIPVVATRQGGILDFVDDSGGLLIDGPAAVRGAASGGYAEWSGWIDPDVNAAAAAMRRVMRDYPAEVARARTGRERLGAHASRDAVLRAYRAAVADDHGPVT